MNTRRAFRTSVLAITAILALAACTRGNIAFTPETAQPNSTVTISSTAPCLAPDGEVLANQEIQLELRGNPTELTYWYVTTDADGMWESTIETANVPGQQHVMAICTSYAESWHELFQVEQPALDLTLSAYEVDEGATVTADAAWCVNETFGGLESDPGEPPVLEFLLDGEVTATFMADDIRPTGTVETSFDLEDAGEYEITARCSYNSVILDLDTLIEDGNNGGYTNHSDYVHSLLGHITQTAQLTVLGESEPEPEPEPTPTPTPDPEPAPTPTPEPTPDTDPDPLPPAVPAPRPKPEPKPTPKPSAAKPVKVDPRFAG